MSEKKKKEKEMQPSLTHQKPQAKNNQTIETAQVTEGFSLSKVFTYRFKY